MTKLNFICKKLEFKENIGHLQDNKIIAKNYVAQNAQKVTKITQKYNFLTFCD